jgi:hypothetical protein
MEPRDVFGLILIGNLRRSHGRLRYFLLPSSAQDIDHEP